MNRLAPFAGWTALVSGSLALLILIALPQFQWWVYAFGGLALVNGIFFLVVDRENVRRAIRSRQTIYGMNATVLGVVMLGILVFANLLAVRHKHSFDFTESGYFTLAPQTIKVLENLTREVKMTAFFPDLPQPEKAQFQTLMNLIQQHTDKIKLEIVDPEKSPLIARQHKFTGYGMVSYESGGKTTAVNKPNEESILNALLQVTTDQKKKVYFVEGHNEAAIGNSEQKGFAKASAALQQDGFEVGTVLLLQTQKVPEDADLLIINGPSKIIQRAEQDAIEAYLDRGGSVLILLDPQVEVGISSLLNRWGVQVQDDIIIDPRSQLAVGNFAVPVINHYAQHGITQDFTLPTVFPLLRSVRPLKTEGIEAKALLFSSPESWAETGYRTEYGTGKVQFNQDKDIQGPVPVAVVASRTPAAPETTPPGSDSKTTPGADSKPKANLVVVGDSDFATNQYFEVYGNGDFFSNTASWLLQEENLISIRPRERKNTPLALTAAENNLIFILGILVFPGAVLLAGLRVWWRRRSL